MSNQKSFTLSETMITLVILGVIAAITVPSVIRNYQRRLVETRIKEFYSAMTSAIEQSQIANGMLDTWENDRKTNDSAYNITNKYILPYLNITKVNAPNNPLAELSYDVANPSNNSTSNRVMRYCLKNNICFYDTFLMNGNKVTYDTRTDSNYRYYARMSTIIFDVNGPAKPNVLGKDNFYLQIFKDINGGYAYVSGYEWPKESRISNQSRKDYKNYCYNGYNTAGCSTVIINNGFKIPKDYPWL